MALHPALISLAEEVLATDQLCLYLARVLMKDKYFDSSVVVHQDYPYFQDGHTNKLNIFLAVTTCHERNGMLEFYRGSHRYGPLPRGEITAELFPQFEPCIPLLNVGDALLADFLLWHGSIPAVESEPRIMLQIAFQSADDPSARNAIRGNELCPKTPLPRYPIKNPEPSFSCIDARMAFEEGDYDTAYNLAGGLLKRDNNNVPVQLLLHDIARVRGDKAVAAKLLDQARVALSEMEQEIGRRDANGSVLPSALALVGRHGCSRIGLCWFQPPDETAVKSILSWQKFAFVLLDASANPLQALCGLPVFDISQAASGNMVDAVLVIDGANLAWLMRCLEPLARRNVLILPYDADWIVPAFFRNLTPDSGKTMELGVAPNYVWTSALTGHYAEFGTFWGQAFFPDVFRYRNLLKGRFYAFDSFEGLSTPLSDEVRFHVDFQKGHYCANQRSFHALAELVSAPADMIQVVPGFFDTNSCERPGELWLDPGIAFRLQDRL